VCIHLVGYSRGKLETLLKNLILLIGRRHKIDRLAPVAIFVTRQTDQIDTRLKFPEPHRSAGNRNDFAERFTRSFSQVDLPELVAGIGAIGDNLAPQFDLGRRVGFRGRRPGNPEPKDDH
jgi:hypothetical protein